MKDFFDLLAFIYNHLKTRLGVCLVFLVVVPAFILYLSFPIDSPVKIYNLDFLKIIQEYEAYLVYGILEVILFECLYGYRSFRLLHDYYKRQAQNFPGFSALRMVIGCLKWGDYPHVWEATRVRIEWQLWLPEKDKPVPAKDEDDPAKEEAEIPNEPAFVKNFVRQYSKEIKGNSPEKVNMEKYDDISPPIPNCFVLTKSEKRELISAYFQAIQKINPKVPLKHKFLTEAVIETGYLAPQQLLAGLLSEFKDSWPSLLRSYRIEAKDSESKLQDAQRFIFYCWLLWGPSIPLGRCEHYWTINGNQGITALQYGFGDENNSLSLLPLVNPLQDDKEYGNLFKRIMESPLAQEMKLKVRPVWISNDTRKSATELETSLDSVGNIQRAMFNIPKSILKDKNKSASSNKNDQPDDPPGYLALDYAELIDLNDNKGKRKDSAKYYSAYVWVMFILCNNDKYRTPLYPSSDQPWLGMFPFFEHGNIANDSTYALFKSQLADKTLASISRLLEEDNSKSYVFQYACASDHSNCLTGECNTEYVLGDFQSAIRIRDYIENLLGAPNEKLQQSDAMKSVKKVSGHFKHLENKVFLGEWPSKDLKSENKAFFSACQLPTRIEKFHEHNRKNIEPHD